MSDETSLNGIRRAGRELFINGDKISGMAIRADVYTANGHVFEKDAVEQMAVQINGKRHYIFWPCNVNLPTGPQQNINEIAAEVIKATVNQPGQMYIEARIAGPRGESLKHLAAVKAMTEGILVSSNAMLRGTLPNLALTIAVQATPGLGGVIKEALVDSIFIVDLDSL
jgi:hypothetical protein